jgi:ATP-dependent helicase YprA (DUF1998 family)
VNVFELRENLINNYASYIDSFINIRDPQIRHFVRHNLDDGLLWPQPLIQLNPSFQPGHPIDDLAQEGSLHPECARVFRLDKGKPEKSDRPLLLHRHQEDDIRLAQEGHNYVLTTGTGSGKSLAYIVPIVNDVLRRGPGRGITAIVVYPMNALANSQYGEMEKFLCRGYPDGPGWGRHREFRALRPSADRRARHGGRSGNRAAQGGESRGAWTGETGENRSG